MLDPGQNGTPAIALAIALAGDCGHALNSSGTALRWRAALHVRALAPPNTVSADKVVAKVNGLVCAKWSLRMAPVDIATKMKRGFGRKPICVHLCKSVAKN
jgi:hypothetical protein